ncbi:unnamed protein product [Caenorhabditis auriculariae]|uniref:Uncharacterized protein n=1 Tax=Caenorhabditis auriculariae TaxID=2777116 RepID=A0A8S1HP50_9PELO|nr:unnamed protein product [Caenorhabditis auriculariae]
MSSSAVVTFKAVNGGDEPNGAASGVIRPSDHEAKEMPLPPPLLGPQSSTTLTNQQREQQHKEKLGHRRIDKQGEVSYKKVPTNALMQAIQLGIANSIGSLASMPNRDLLLQDFEKVDNVNFPAAGSPTTPSHSFGDFRFRTYAPIAFRYFRDLFHIKPADFLAGRHGQKRAGSGLENGGTGQPGQERAGSGLANGGTGRPGQKPAGSGLANGGTGRPEQKRAGSGSANGGTGLAFA